jgi:hypothetical protein
MKSAQKMVTLTVKNWWRSLDLVGSKMAQMGMNFLNESQQANFSN